CFVYSFNVWLLLPECFEAKKLTDDDYPVQFRKMVAGCGNKCIKYIFWLINFLFFALGAAIVGLSVWLRFDKSFLSKAISTVRIDTDKLPLESFYWILYVTIAFGLVLLILGFLGCCGSACEVICAIGLVSNSVNYCIKKSCE
ncbi:hypothetical protein GCK32_000768, partial [Trichostrongylus colubriformis]